MRPEDSPFHPQTSLTTDVAAAPIGNARGRGRSETEAQDVPSSTPASAEVDDDSSATPCTVPRVAARTRLQFNEKDGAAYTSSMSVHDIL